MIGIIGAGISGLVLAYELEKKGIEYVLLESSGEPGGVIRTASDHGYLIELGPNSLLCDDKLLAYLEEIGLKHDILHANEVNKNRYILKDNHLQVLPDSPRRLLNSSFFQFSTKFKIFTEPFRKFSSDDNETLSTFFRKRFGDEVVDYVLNPFVTGIYAGDPDKLLLKETFPALAEYVQKYGSILRGLKNDPPVRKSSISFTNGMQQLPLAFAQKVKDIRYNSFVSEISRTAKGFSINIKGQDAVQVDKVVIACPAYAAADMLKDTAPELARALKKVYYPPMVVSHLVYDKFFVKNELNGFGGLHPYKEQKFTAGSIWTSSIFKGRCGSNEVLFTAFVGGALNALNTTKDEAFIKNKVHMELAKIYTIKGEYKLNRQYRWEKSIPQYDENILLAKTLSTNVENGNIFVCASWKNGISIADRIRNAIDLAESLATDENRPE